MYKSEAKIVVIQCLLDKIFVFVYNSMFKYCWHSLSQMVKYNCLNLRKHHTSDQKYKTINVEPILPTHYQISFIPDE
jgi:hypothetical protein